MSLDDAALQCGIPISECIDYINGKMAVVDTLNFELRKFGQEAVKNALTKLTELASGDARQGKFFESTDLLAARELAKIGMEALKLSKSGLAVKDKDTGERDLFDASQDPWVLRPIE